ncbi:MAG: type 4a pilus biogenesis protein PilO, partial [Polyangiaceae bacterium]
PGAFSLRTQRQGEILMASPVQNAMAKLPPAAKVGVGASVVLVMFFAYWFIFYSDVASKIAGAERQKRSLHEELTKEQQAQATYLADRGELALREQRARDLNKVLPPDQEEDGFLSSVQQASNAAGIDLKGYTPLDEVRQSFYAKSPMRLDLSGKFHQIAKFAYELGKVDRIINVENIELTNPTVSGDEVTLHARCLATAFHALAPKETPGAAASPTAVATPAGGAK